MVSLEGEMKLLKLEREMYKSYSGVRARGIEARDFLIGHLEEMLQYERSRVSELRQEVECARAEIERLQRAREEDRQELARLNKIVTANGITCGSRVANSNVTTVSSASQGTRDVDSARLAELSPTPPFQLLAGDAPEEELVTAIPPTSHTFPSSQALPTSHAFPSSQTLPTSHAFPSSRAPPTSRALPTTQATPAPLTSQAAPPGSPVRTAIKKTAPISTAQTSHISQDNSLRPVDEQDQATALTPTPQVSVPADPTSDPENTELVSGGAVLPSAKYVPQFPDIREYMLIRDAKLNALAVLQKSETRRLIKQTRLTQGSADDLTLTEEDGRQLDGAEKSVRGGRRSRGGKRGGRRWINSVHRAPETSGGRARGKRGRGRPRGSMRGTPWERRRPLDDSRSRSPGVNKLLKALSTPDGSSKAERMMVNVLLSSLKTIPPPTPRRDQLNRADVFDEGTAASTRGYIGDGTRERGDKHFTPSRSDSLRRRFPESVARKVYHECRYCDSKFLRHHNLKKHLLIHIEDPCKAPGVMPIPSARDESPEEEEEEEEDRGSLRCKHCGKTYVRLRPYQKHLANHSRGSRFRAKGRLALDPLVGVVPEEQPKKRKRGRPPKNKAPLPPAPSARGGGSSDKPELPATHTTRSDVSHQVPPPNIDHNYSKPLGSPDLPEAFPDSEEQPEELEDDHGEPQGPVPAEEPQGLVPAEEPQGLVPAKEPQGLVPAEEHQGLVPAEEPQGLVPAEEPQGLVPAEEPQGPEDQLNETENQPEEPEKDSGVGPGTVARGKPAPPPGPKKLQCKYCDRVYVRADFFKKHLLMHQEGVEEKSVPAHMHRKAGYFEEPMHCEHCDKSFSRIYYFQRHQLGHIKEQESRKEERRPAPEETRKEERRPAPEETRKEERRPVPEETRKEERRPAPEEMRKEERRPAPEETRKEERRPVPEETRREERRPETRREERRPAPEETRKEERRPALEETRKEERRPAPEETRKEERRPAPEETRSEERRPETRREERRPETRREERRPALEETRKEERGPAPGPSAAATVGEARRSLLCEHCAKGFVSSPAFKKHQLKHKRYLNLTRPQLPPAPAREEGGEERGKAGEDRDSPETHDILETSPVDAAPSQNTRGVKSPKRARPPEESNNENSGSLVTEQYVTNSETDSAPSPAKKRRYSLSQEPSKSERRGRPRKLKHMAPKPEPQPMWKRGRPDAFPLTLTSDSDPEAPIEDRASGEAVVPTTHTVSASDHSDSGPELPGTVAIVSEVTQQDTVGHNPAASEEQPKKRKRGRPPKNKGLLPPANSAPKTKNLVPPAHKSMIPSAPKNKDPVPLSVPGHPVANAKDHPAMAKDTLSNSNQNHSKPADIQLPPTSLNSEEQERGRSEASASGGLANTAAVEMSAEEGSTTAVASKEGSKDNPATARPVSTEQERRDGTASSEERSEDNPARARPVSTEEGSTARTRPVSSDGQAKSSTPPQKKLYQCEYCSKRFVRLFYLQQHFKTHRSQVKTARVQSPSGSGTMTCKYCGKRFVRPVCYQKHLLKHGKEQGREMEAVSSGYSDDTERESSVVRESPDAPSLAGRDLSPHKRGSEGSEPVTELNSDLIVPPSAKRKAEERPLKDKKVTTEEQPKKKRGRPPKNKGLPPPAPSDRNKPGVVKDTASSSVITTRATSTQSAVEPRKPASTRAVEDGTDNVADVGVARKKGAKEGVSNSESSNHAAPSTPPPPRYERSGSPEVPFQVTTLNVSVPIPPTPPPSKPKRRKTLESVLSSILERKNSPDDRSEKSDDLAKPVPENAPSEPPKQPPEPRKQKGGKEEKKEVKKSAGVISKRKTLFSNQARRNMEGFQLSVVSDKVEKSNTIKLKTSMMIAPKMKAAL